MKQETSKIMVKNAGSTYNNGGVAGGYLNNGEESGSRNYDGSGCRKHRK